MEEKNWSWHIRSLTKLSFPDHNLIFSRHHFKDQYFLFSEHYYRSPITDKYIQDSITVNIFTFGKKGSLERVKSFQKYLKFSELSINQTLLSSHCPPPLSRAGDGEQLKSYPELRAPGPYSSSSSLSATRANQTLLIHGIRIILINTDEDITSNVK